MNEVADVTANYFLIVKGVILLIITIVAFAVLRFLKKRLTKQDECRRQKDESQRLTRLKEEWTKHPFDDECLTEFFTLMSYVNDESTSKKDCSQSILSENKSEKQETQNSSSETTKDETKKSAFIPSSSSGFDD